MTRRLAIFLMIPVAIACVPQPPPAVAPDAQVTQVTVDPHAEAIGHDAAATPEPVREALKQFRDRFACNNISGCTSEQVLIEYGWRSRSFLQQIFEKAPAQATYRARAVRIVAELRDPLGRSFLRDRLQDTDPEVRAYALFGLGLIDDRDVQHLLPTVGRDDPSAWMAPVRLSALWLAMRWGDATAQRAFLRQMAILAQEQLAVQGLVWGLTLCMRDDGPDCHRVLPLVARHPNFLVRRQVAKAMAMAPLASYAQGLVGLTTETARSIADPAETALRALTGEKLQGAAQWQAWCKQTHCERDADEAIAALQADLTPTAP